MHAALQAHYGGPQQPKPLAYQVADKVGMGQVLGALDGLQHHGLNAVHGLAQLGEHGLNAAANALLPAPQHTLSGLVSGQQPEATGLAGVRQSINRATAADDASIAQRERDYQARTAGNAGSYVGAAAGEILPWMVGVGEARALGLLPKATSTLGKAGLLAGEGAAMGAATPVTEGGDYATQKATQIGVGAVAAPLLHGVTVGAGRVARATLDHLTDAGHERLANARLASLVGVDPQAAAQALRNAPQYVPGEQPSIAQVLTDPKVLQAERALRNNPHAGPAFVAQDVANDDARRQVVQGLAGTDQQLADAVAARRDGPGAFWRDNLARGAEDNRYGRAQQHIAGFLQSRPLNMTEFNVLDQARKIAGQVQRGSIGQAEGDAAIRALAPATGAGRKALDQALGIIDSGMLDPSRLIGHLQTLSKDTNPTIAKTANSALDALARNQDGQGWVHARVLDGVRRNIGSMLRENAPMGGVGSQEGAAYGPLKAKIANALDRAIPGYRANLAAYAGASQPINDMQAARSLLGAMDRGGRNAGGDQVVNLSQIRSALGANDRADFPMSPEAEAKLEGVLRSRQRAGISDNKVGTSGSATDANEQARGLLGDSVRKNLGKGVGTIAGGLLSHLSGMPLVGDVGGMAIGGQVGGLLDKVAAKADAAVLGKVGSKAANAQKAADALEAYRLQQLRRQQGLLGQLPNYLLPYGAPQFPLLMQQTP
jgi:hypothetical protein